MRLSALLRPAAVLAVLGACLISLSACGGGGGGSSSGRLALDTVTAESGPELPWDQFFLNERVVFKFSANVDPATVNRDTIQIRLARTNFTVAADGVFTVEGDTVTFVPVLPSQADLSDAGLEVGEEYRVFVPGFPSSNTVRSLSGNELPGDFRTTFSTRTSSPFLLDPVAGPPAVVAVALDLNGDGILDADGDLGTPNTEEFPPTQFPLSDNAPVGLARSPLKIGILVNEPILPETVFEDFDEDGLLDNVALFDVDTGARLAFEVELEQEFIAELNSFRVVIVVLPITTLPPGTRIEARLFEGITDTANPPFELRRYTTGFTTLVGPATFVDAIQEDFDDRKQFDPSTSAEWDAGNSNFLQAGRGLGGSGIDGVLQVMTGEIEVDTSENGGFFNYTDIFVGPDATILGLGPNPLRLFSTGNVDIQGQILVNGGSGNAGARRGGSQITVGGVGGPGGGDGGNANDPPNVSFADDNCQLADDGSSPVPMGGGEGGKIGFSFAGGGGGGGHAEEGGGATGSGAADGGVMYGDEAVTELLGGSGGGGGGDGSRNDTPEDESTGGAGGAGGGALLISAAGNFSLTGTVNADGGDGGAGGVNRGQTPGGGGGGGGSGGSVKVQAFTVAPINDPAAVLVARGGIRGSSGGGGSRNGGGGSPGRIRIEAFDANANGLADEISVAGDPTTVDPAPSLAVIGPGLLGVTFAQSLFLDTGTESGRFSFDASDPVTGIASVGPSIEDLLIPDGIPSTATVRVLFEGAPESMDQPNTPDMDNTSGFVTDITQLNGFRFIRYRLEFEVGENIQTAIRPIVEFIQLKFEFDI